MLKSFLRVINRLFKYNAVEWNIGVLDFDSIDLLNTRNIHDIKWVKHNYKNRWFADPFIVSTSTNEIILLVEEFEESKRKGKISKMIIDAKNNKVKSLTTILELNTHLSFPAIYRKDNEIYIYPENSQSGELLLYKYNPDDDSVEIATTLVNEDRVVDSSLITINNRNFLFATCKPKQSEDIVSVYESLTWNGKYEKIEEIRVEPKVARGAGDIFCLNNEWIRPSQDCNGGYGKGIVFSRLSIENNRFKLEELNRIYPNKSEFYNEGIHTFNILDKTVVIDGYRYKHAIFAKLVNTFRSIIGI
ncbi:hypothetical protein [Marinifilum sp. D714]|uniref:glucosamine inositolphosphorylceramide transferase family protein n=1 Tax=Marinifilum sp. D714 TaxID=2937523 RepID=UPI0027BD49C1|nr:hypothetical protein [Marinifilum sp. D714]MDQ2178549.1 hypothetical protein [Marinifilum sp. D714]